MAIKDLLRSLFRLGEPESSVSQLVEKSSSPGIRTDNPNEPAQICSPKVLLCIIDPLADTETGRTLHQEMGWARPDDLARKFIADILQASAGLVRYRITERVEINEFPVLADGFQYGIDAYRELMRGSSAAHKPPGLDYTVLLEKLHVMPRIENGQIDEVWVMAFPHAGLYESVMGGEAAFWCNAPPLAETTSCKRRFVVMGFSCEREVGEMLHSFNHRAEAILAQLFGSLEFLAWTYKVNRTPSAVAPAADLNLFQQFILFDLIAPGRAGVGTVHYPPNGVRDYDLGNARLVRSTCYDWLRFPNFQGDTRMISASEWGGGTERAYQRWWLNHLPKVAGRKDGIHNNWWQYIANLDNLADQSG